LQIRVRVKHCFERISHRLLEAPHWLERITTREYQKRQSQELQAQTRW
jgi:hypothetical protein